MRRVSIGWALAVVCVCGANFVAAQTAWLDQPLTGWNAAGAPLPKGTAGAAARADALKRCKLVPPSTATDRALEAADWIPQLHLDRPLISNDVEIVAGFSSLDASCAPAAFNLFVFVDGRFAGTLSPGSMTPRTDASAGPVRFVNDGISAEFARYKPGDADCCPTARVAVQYRIDRTPTGPSVVPVNVRTIRSY
jgi:LppP/LprE lipoprotein